MSGALEPARVLTADDVDAIITARAEMDRAFWRTLGLARRSGFSANAIAKKVHEAGIASRPTTLDRLRDVAMEDLATDLAQMPEAFGLFSESLEKATDVFRRLRDQLEQSASDGE